MYPNLKTWPLLLTIIFVVLFALTGAAQEKPIVVKGRVNDKLLFLQVTVNGKGPFWFAVDSGAYHSVVDDYVVKEVGLKKLAKSSTTGTGKGTVPIEATEPFTMRIGALKVKVAEPMVIDLSGVPIPKWVHGLVGVEVFEQNVVQIDPITAAFRFFAPEHFTPPANATSVTIENANHRLFLNVTIEVNDHQTVTHRLRVDTGSGDSVADDVVKDGENVQQTTLGNGLGENFKGYSGIYKAVTLGPYTFKKVWGPGSPHPAIGMELLRRFTLTFDLPHGKLYLQPNKNFGEPVPAPGG